MIAFNEIERAAEHLGKAADAEQVILFGSYARGNAKEESDVDFLVVAPSSQPRFKRSRELYALFRPYPFAMDVVVYTPQEIEQGKRLPTSFVSTVLREGKVLYARRKS